VIQASAEEHQTRIFSRLFSDYAGSTFALTREDWYGPSGD